MKEDGNDSLTEERGKREKKIRKAMEYRYVYVVLTDAYNSAAVSHNSAAKSIDLNAAPTSEPKPLHKLLTYFTELKKSTGNLFHYWKTLKNHWKILTKDIIYLNIQVCPPSVQQHLCS